MPYTFLHIKPSRRPYLVEAEILIFNELPGIIAEELTVRDLPVHEGGLSPSEIMIWPLGDHEPVNGKDIEILVFAHPFELRMANIEERKDAVIARLKHRFEENHESLTFAVCIIMAPMAYGEAKVINPMP